MLTLQEQSELASHAPDTERMPAEIIASFFDLWLQRSTLNEEERQSDIRDFLRLCMRSWLTQPRLPEGMAVDPSHADDLLIGLLNAYTMLEYDSIEAGIAEDDEMIIPVVAHFSVPVYPDPEKEEFETRSYRRKMLLRCCLENGEWGLDPNSIFKQESA